MNALTVSLVIEPPVLEPTGIFTPARQMFEFDEFARALGSALSLPVDVLEVPLQAAPAHGIILVYLQGSLQDYLASVPDGRKAAERIFLLEASRASLPGVLEHFGLAGAVESYRYFRWRQNRSGDFGGQVYGRCDVANKMGAVIAPPPWSGDTYCLFDVPGTTDLPGALARYLLEYWKAH